ncbi:MAG: ABC transporter ATP-binding protein [Anaerolineae bacterium]|nr:ABC transporter ATP-binding protein [Anaerolineae bacterium]
MSEHAVELVRVDKHFGTVVAVDTVSLSIRNGEFYSLLGPSGCGKTTTLRLIAGFEMPTAGQVYIDGELQGETPPYRRPVNTVFQNYALFPHMSVFQNVAFGLEMRHVSKEVIQHSVFEVLEMVQLPGMERRRPGQLSGGQQQRVALARALVNHPKVLLLDEPLGALDLKLRKAMQLELKALQERVGITFIYVTHDQEEALTMSDRIAVMNKGQVLQIGTPEEIYERPASRFVADFIGETNFLEGKVAAVRNGEVAVEIGDALLVYAPLERDAVVGDTVVIAVRPEKISLSTTPEDPRALPGVVREVVYVGTDTRYLAELAGQVTVMVREQNLAEETARRLSAGTAVYVCWQPQSARLLRG